MWNDLRSNTFAALFTLHSSYRELWRNIKTAPARLWIDMPALLLFPVKTKAQQFFISTVRVSISKEEFLHLLSHIASSEKHFDANAAMLDCAEEWKCDGREILKYHNLKSATWRALFIVGTRLSCGFEGKCFSCGFYLSFWIVIKSHYSSSKIASLMKFELLTKSDDIWLICITS